MLVSWEDFLKSLGSKDFCESDHYLFWGEQDYFLQKSVKRLIELWSDEGKSDLNFTQVQASKIGSSVEAFQEFLELLLTYPFLKEKRFILLEDGDLLTEEQWVQLVGKLRETSLPSILVITAAAIDKRKKWFQKLVEVKDASGQPHLACVEFKRIPEYKMGFWIQWIANWMGLKLGSQVTEKLLDRLGADLRAIELAFEKLGNASAGEPISAQQVEALIPKSREENVFQWIDEWSHRGNVIKLLTSFQDLQSQGSSVFQLLSLLSRQIRILLKAKLMNERTKGEHALSENDYAQYLGVPGFVVKKVLKQESLWTLEELEEALMSIAKIDRALKTSSAPEKLLIENFLIHS